MNTPLGRADEARWIEARLVEPAGPIVGLIGPPGIGKSTLLKHACAAHQRAGHPVITLAGEPDAASLWARLALAAQLTARDEAGALRGLASAPASLIAIDAAEAGLTVCADVLARVRAAAPQHALLYASRERAPLDAALLWVRPLPRDASRALFAARAARLCGEWTPDDPAALDALLDLLGDHPLALSLVAARCAVLSASQLLALVRADLLGAAASPEGTSVGLEEALGAAWRDLGEPQRDALGVIACFQGQLPLEEVWSALERCGCAPSRLGAVDLSQRLVAASWLERAEVAGVPQLWLHVTTRAFIRAQLDHDPERHARLRSAWLDAVSALAAALGIAPPYEHRALPALRALDAALADLEAAFEAALPSRPADACQLLLARSASLAALGQLARALRVLDDARAPWDHATDAQRADRALLRAYLRMTLHREEFDQIECDLRAVTMPTTPQRIHQLILLARAHNWRAEPLSIPLARDAVALLEHFSPSWMHGAGYVEYAMALSIHGDAAGAAVNVLNQALERFDFLSQTQRSSIYFYMVEICLRACDYEGAMVATARSVEALRGLEHLPLYLRAAVRRALMCGYAGRVDAEERAALLARLTKELESGNKMLGLWGSFVLGVAALSAPGEEGRALLVRAADAAQDYEEMRAFVLYYVAILDHVEGRIGAAALEAARPAPELLDAEGETVAQLADALVSEAGRARWIAALAASPSQGQAVVWEGLSAGVAAWGMAEGLSAASDAGEALRVMGRAEETLGAGARYMHPLARRLAAAVRARARGARWRLWAPPRWVGWLEVGAGGAWFRCDGGEQVAVLSARSSALANILWALAGEAAAGRSCDAERLIEAGWPDEQIMAEAAANRLYMAISTLRRRGLAQVLITVEGGYTLRLDYALALCVDQQQG